MAVYTPRGYDINFTYSNRVPGATSGADDLSGTKENDLIRGLDGTDTLTGLQGNDILVGTTYSDSNSNDRDILIGGPGRDLFVIGGYEQSLYLGGGFGILKDYKLSEDYIQLNSDKPIRIVQEFTQKTIDGKNTDMFGNPEIKDSVILCGGNRVAVIPDQLLNDSQMTTENGFIFVSSQQGYAYTNDLVF